MSIRMSSARRTAAVTLAAAAVVAASTSVAAADPPALNQDSCSTTLAKAAIWPGTITVGESKIRLVSDAFDSYLSRQSPCAPDRSQL